MAKQERKCWEHYMYAARTIVHMRESEMCHFSFYWGINAYHDLPCRYHNPIGVVMYHQSPAYWDVELLLGPATH